MIIKKIKINNFKKFKDETTIEFNDDFNIIIGNNESGKSTILQAIELVLSGSQARIDSIGLENIFNNEVIDNFMNGEKEYKNLPEIYIELYLNDTDNLDLNGNNNTEKIMCDGLYLKISPNDEFSKEIYEILEKKNFAFPFEYYKCEFKKFSDSPFNNYNRPIHYVVIDNSNISNEYFMKEYISNLYCAYADLSLKNQYNNDFRKLKKDFEENNLKELNEKVPEIDFGLSTHTKYSLENNLTIYEQGINIQNKGSGNQCILKIKSSIDKCAENIDIILIEEPENHLSDMNMKKMLIDIISNKSKQTFITTHNSVICSRLNLKKLIALGERNNVITSDFRKIDKDTADFFIKCPSYNILNFILSKKVILVEGAAEYILMEKFYKIINRKNPNEDEVNIISVSGLSFERYLKIAQALNIEVAVLTDNDCDYKNNITQKYAEYINDKIKVYSDSNNDRHTFEVCLYEDNKDLFENKMKLTKSSGKLKFMINNKAESAYRILKELENSNITIKIPNYIKDALEWIKL